MDCSARLRDMPPGSPVVKIISRSEEQCKMSPQKMRECAFLPACKSNPAFPEKQERLEKNIDQLEMKKSVEVTYMLLK